MILLEGVFGKSHPELRTVFTIKSGIMMKSFTKNRKTKVDGILSTLRISFTLMNDGDKSKLVLVTFVQFMLAVLDLIAVAIIGVVTGLALAGIQSKSTPETIYRVLEIFRIQDMAFQSQVAILGSLAAIVMVSKTLSSVFLVRRTLQFLAFKAAVFSANLASLVIEQPYEYLKQKSSQSLLYSIIQGTNSLIIGLLGSMIQLVSESLLILIMLIGLLVVEPYISLAAVIYFALIALVQQRLLGTKAAALGASGANAAILSNKKILESLSLYREIYVRQGSKKYSTEITELRKSAASITAKTNFLPYVSKYTLEISLVLGALLLSASQFILSDSIQAITILAIFLAAATRVSPAILRIQQCLIGLRSSSGAAAPTLELLRDIQSKRERVQQFNKVSDPTHEVSLEGVHFSYQNSPTETLTNINLRVKKGEMVAFIGPSGSGKTTLIDLILGLLEPEKGSVLIQGKLPRELIESSPGCIGYVAQDSTLLDGSIRENLVFGMNGTFTDESLLETLKLVSLDNFVNNLPNGLDAIVGERGVLVSGGQRQRICIARALISNPEILILDEATSALDVETEQAITDSIEKIRESRTILVIAHRLSTVLHADNIVFLKNGKIIGQGDFSNLRKSLPDFDLQAQLAGYSSS
jgi:ABC-type multidrug transport system fused ATPase/permease subunit